MSICKKRRPKPQLVACLNCDSHGPFRQRLSVPNAYDPLTPLNIVTCGNCGLCFINPQYSNEAYLDYYAIEYYSEITPEALKEIELRSFNGHRQYGLDFVRKSLSSLPKNGAYLDAGAGLGTFLKLFKEARPDFPDGQIFALEPSVSASQDLLTKFPGIQVICESIEDNSFKEGGFDTVLCAALIEHFTDPLKALISFNRIMKMKGHLILMTPSLDNNPMIRGFSTFFKFVHTFYYTRHSISVLLEKAGFRTKEIVSISGSPTSPYWYPIFWICAEKSSPRIPSDLSRVRCSTESDAKGLSDASRVFGKLRIMIWKEEWQRKRNTITQTMKALVNNLYGMLRVAKRKLCLMLGLSRT